MMINHYVAPGIKSIKPVHKYRRDFLTKEWIENYVSDYFNLPIKVLSSYSEFAKHRQFKSIAFFLMKKMGNYNEYELARMYGVSQTSIHRYSTSAEKEYSKDLNFILKDLNR